jgi:Cu(I)/Ag(I) efflux system membrane fusion protein
MPSRFLFATALLLTGCISSQPAPTSLADPTNPAAPETPTAATPVRTTHPDTTTTHAALAAYFTCIMHPQIHQDHPGKCPICGMDLIKKTFPSAEATQ